MPKVILLLLWLISVYKSIGQVYEPLRPDSLLLQQRVNEKRGLWMNSLKEEDNKLLDKAHKSRYDYLDYGIQNEHFLFGSAIQPFFDHILEQICAANPDIPSKEILLLPTRYAEPNAASLGDGTILINVGLLRRLESESQFAFIICHEIAHYILRHFEQSIVKYAAASKDKSLKKQVRHLSKKGKHTELLEMLEEMLYTHRRLSRKQEVEADALALNYLTNSAYDAAQALRCLEVLDSIDLEKYPGRLDLEAIFQTEAYPFKERWLREEGSIFDGPIAGEEEMFNRDSLQTHPACRERIRLLIASDSLGNAQKKADILQDSTEFQKWVRAADYELIEALYDLEHTALALYHCLKLLQQKPDDPFLYTMTGRCLLQIYDAMEKHQLEEQVPLPTSRMSEDFRQLCVLLHHLRMREVAALAYHFLQQRAEQYSLYRCFQITLDGSYSRFNH